MQGDAMRFLSTTLFLLAIAIVMAGNASGASEDPDDMLVRVNGIDDQKLHYLSYFIDIRYVNENTGWIGGSTGMSIAAMESISYVEEAEWAQDYYVLLNVSARTVRVRNDTYEDMYSYTPETVWDLGFKGSGMIVAILDTGVDDQYQHRLDDQDDDDGTDDPKFIGGYNARTDTEENPDDDNGHGTHVAGIVMGTAGGDEPSHERFLGIAPQARLVDVRVAGSNGQTNSVDLLQGLQWCIDHADTDWENDGEDNNGIDVILMSVGTTDTSDGSDQVSQLVNDAVEAGIVVVAAMGNSNATVVPSPAAADLAIAVGGTNDQTSVERDDDRLWEEDPTTGTNRGPRNDDGDDDPYDEMKPDIVAPAYFITSAEGGASYTTIGIVNITTSRATPMNGTSLSAAHVAGIVALMLEANPDLTPSAGWHPVREILRDTAQARGQPANTSLSPKWNADWGYGALDGYGAVLRALETAGVVFTVPVEVQSDFDTELVAKSPITCTGYTVNETLNMTFTIPRGWREVNSVTFKFDGNQVLDDWDSDEEYGIFITSTPADSDAWTISAWANLTADPGKHWANITLMTRAPIVGSENAIDNYNMTFNRTINGNYSAEVIAPISVTTEWGSMTGRVTDTVDDGPLEGVRVRMTDHQTSTVRNTTYTDADGRYSLINLTEGFYDLNFYLAGYEVDESLTYIQVVKGTENSGNDVELVNEGGNGYIRGFVLTENGSAIEGALVEAKDGGDVIESAETGADGEYSIVIAPGTYDVIASMNGFEDALEEDVDVASGEATALNFTMTEAPLDGRIWGKVTSGGSPVSGATVKAYLDGNLKDEMTTAGNGSYRMVLQAGTYSLRCIKSGYETEERTGIVLPEGGYKEVDITLTEEENLGWIYGTVRRFGTTDSVPDVLVTATDDPYSRSDTSDGFGDFRIDVRAGTFNIMATADGYDDNDVFTGITVSQGSGREIFLEMVRVNVDPEVMDFTIEPATAIPNGRSLILIMAEVEDMNGAEDIESVTVDLSKVGGSGAQVLYDTGTRGDMVADDGTYSYETVVADGTPEGDYKITVTVTDSLDATDTDTFTLKVEKADDDDDDDDTPGFEAVAVIGALAAVFMLAGRKRFK